MSSDIMGSYSLLIYVQTDWTIRECSSNLNQPTQFFLTSYYQIDNILFYTGISRVGGVHS